MDTNEALNAIENREDFVVFLHALILDLGTKPAEWQNETLADYLESMAAWITDTDDYNASKGISVSKQPSWKALGEALLAAKYYE